MKDFPSIPTAPRALPLIGHVVPLLRDPLAFLNSLPAHGELVRIRLGPLAVVVVCDPELTRQVLLDDRVFDKGGPLYDRLREVIGDGVVSCRHQAHRRLRRLSQPAFHQARLPDYARAMTTCVQETTDSWSPGQVLDVPAEMMTTSSRIITATLFSDTLPSTAHGRLVSDVTTVVKSLYQRMFLIPPLDRLPTPGNRAHLAARARLHDTVERIIAQRRADGADHGDLLSALVAAHDPEDDRPGMTGAEISDTIVSFILAGIESTAATLSSALDLLARHPEVERRVHAEVDTALRGAPATHADLPRLPLTERVITETLRLRPPGWFFTRAVTADTHLGGHLLQAGTSVAYSPYLIHHRPDLYPDPEAFAPDRWASPHPRPPRHAFLPFAAGARKCIGDSFSMVEATLALATIASRWHLEHVPGHRGRLAAAVTLELRDLRMRVRPRTAMPASTVRSQVGDGRKSFPPDRS
ncbi:cytochrome P450 [Streptomyces sp. NBC_00094]|uniref:cytochrome P450 n=1 Tax=Streptomyces sp. NBC_00094 TaxID=2903620 RepID=UPI002251DD66|nr:cytochrome P450 [Streptomyces sp. NBC_00094]MCX5390407.1 cytochrome P450 [Streptomyces sp. NBC_00094]